MWEEFPSCKVLVHFINKCAPGGPKIRSFLKKMPGLRELFSRMWSYVGKP